MGASAARSRGPTGSRPCARSRAGPSPRAARGRGGTASWRASSAGSASPCGPRRRPSPASCAGRAWSPGGRGGRGGPTAPARAGRRRPRRASCAAASARRRRASRGPPTSPSSDRPPGREVCLSAVRGRLDSSVVAWRAGERPDAALANSTPEGACARLTPGGRPVIHSDRGGRYRWPGWVSTCENNGLTRSMPARGRSPDNAAMEGLFGLPKKGLRHGGDWSGRTPARLIEGLGGRIGRYDTERRSDALGGRTPAEFRAALVEWSRFPGQLFKHLQAASRSKSQGAIYPFLECSRCLL